MTSAGSDDALASSGGSVGEATGDAPVQLDQEWANALTHGIAALGAVLLGGFMILQATSDSTGLAIACAAYALSVVGTFVFSTLSHSIHRQPLLNRLRAWDQAMIYLMIVGTYTPIAFKFGGDTRSMQLAAIWIAATIGVWMKIGVGHRINSVSTVSYLLLGWLPAIPLAGHVPRPLVWAMVVGGVLYSIGVMLLINDRKFRYAHAMWHLMVMTAATCHWLGIYWYVVS